MRSARIYLLLESAIRARPWILLLNDEPRNDITFLWLNKTRFSPTSAVNLEIFAGKNFRQNIFLMHLIFIA